MPISHTFAGISLKRFGFLGRVVGAVSDPYFNYTTLLLPGNGTNGAQNNTFLDSSTNAFSITRNGNTTQGTFSPFSQTGWSNYFDGTGDYLTVADNAAFAFGSGDFTIECWVYNSGTDGFIATQTDNSTAAGSSFVLYVTSGALNALVYYSGSSFVSIADSANFPLNQWVHIALVRSSTTVTLYVNGSSRGTGNISTNSVNDVSSVVAIGARSTGSDPLTGYISNLRIVKGTAVYTAAFTPPTSALTAITNTSLLTCQSNRFVDNSTNAFAITVNGNTSVQAFSPFAPTSSYSAATVGGSGYFDGTGDSLACSTAALVGSTGSTFSAEAWIYLTSYSSSSTQPPMLALDGEAAANPLYLAFGPRNDGKLTLFWYDSDVRTAVGGTVIPLNTWTHVAVKVNSNAITLYVNAVAESLTGTTTLANRGGTSSQFAVGGNNYNKFFGYIASLRVTNTAITPTLPTAPATAVTGTQLLLNFTNAGILDATAKNDLETVGNAQISTTQSKFGGSSMYFDGTGDRLYTDSSQALSFGTGDFTVEFWFYLNASGTVRFIAGTTSGGSDTFIMYIFNSSELSILIGSDVYNTATTINTGTWYHYAATRSNGTVRLFLNGTQIGTNTTLSSSVANTRITIGDGIQYTGALNGYIDDLRITKGIARYTANFTPPTAAFELQ